jgi:hypothetical protein
VTGTGKPGTGSVTGTPGVTSGGTVGTGNTGERAYGEGPRGDAVDVRTRPGGRRAAGEPEDRQK